MSEQESPRSPGLAHSISAGVVLLLAGLIALRNRSLATIIANIVFIGSISVGCTPTPIWSRKGSSC